MATEEHFEKALAEEREIKARMRRLEKARRIKVQTRQAAVWGEVKKRKREHRCRCELRPGMTERDIVALGAGCTGIEARRARGEDAATVLGPTGWVCPVLIYYRAHARKETR